MMRRWVESRRYEELSRMAERRKNQEVV